MLIDIVYNIIISNCLMIKSFVKAAQDITPFFIIINNGTHHVKQVASFIIHIARAFFIYIIWPYNWTVIHNQKTGTVNIFLSCLLAITVFNKQRLGIVGKAFMYP